MIRKNKKDRMCSIVHKSLVIYLILFFGYSIASSAQVTIGSNIPPEKGALVDLKQTISDPTNSTNASKGMLLPRVYLTDLNSLSPLVDINSPNYTDLKLSHEGITVYNMNNAGGTTGLEEDIYYWDSEKWERIYSSSGPYGSSDVIKYFILPSFNLKTAAGTHIVNLYTEVVRPYLMDAYSSGSRGTNSPQIIPTTKVAGDFYYYVTNSSTSTLTISSITDGGEMTYRSTGSSTANAFVNIIVVFKPSTQ